MSMKNKAIRRPWRAVWVWALLGIGLSLGCARRQAETVTGLPYWPPGEVILPAPQLRSPRGVGDTSSWVATDLTPPARPPATRRDVRTASSLSSASDNASTVPPLPTAPGMRPPPPSEARWRSAADRWIGVPHRLGGEDRTGVDCSALTRALYVEVAGMEIPRTTSDQWQSGEPVDLRGIRAGDLVFFLPLAGEDGVAHVGVMVDRREFVHAGTRGGVAYAFLEERYWRERTIGARRLIPWP